MRALCYAPILEGQPEPAAGHWHPQKFLRPQDDEYVVNGKTS